MCNSSHNESTEIKCVTPVQSPPSKPPEQSAPQFGLEQPPPPEQRPRPHKLKHVNLHEIGQCGIFWSRRQPWMSQIRGNSFPENTFVQKRHCCTKISGFWAEIIPSDVPKSGKLISRKHVCPKSALSHKDFRHFVQIMWIFLLGVFDTFLFLDYLRA